MQTSLTVSSQRSPKSEFKYSLRQHNNVATMLSRALPQRYDADFEHVRTQHNLQIMTNTVSYMLSYGSRCHVLAVTYSFYVTCFHLLVLFHMNIIVAITTSLHEDCGPCYLYLPISSYTYTLLLCWKIKNERDRLFHQQIGPQITVQLYILRVYSSVKICSNLTNKCRTLSIVLLQYTSF